MKSEVTAVMHKLIGVSRMHKTVCEKETQQLELHRSQNVLLSLLAKQNEPMSQVDIANMLEISTAAACVSIKKLVSGGYIEKNSRLSDNRKNNIKITNKGLAAVEKTHEIFSRLDERVFENFTNEELCELERLLQKAEDALKKIGKEEKI